MTLIRAIAFLLHFTLVPVAVGRLITYKLRKTQDESPIATYVLGLFGALGIFYIFCSILVWHQYWNTFTEPFTGCFTALCIAYSVVIAVLAIVWIKKDLAAIKKFPAYVRAKFAHCKGNFKNSKLIAVYALIFVALLVVQLYFAFAYEINEWSYDDYDYVVNSQDTITTDTIAYANFITGEMPYTSEKRVVTAWPTYIAYLARVSSFEVTTVCHTILPVILLIIAYTVFYYISQFLFKDDENRLIFMILLSMANIFGLYSHYSVTFRLLGAIWQGKAVLCAIAVPFFMVYLFDAYSKEITNSKLISIALFSLGSCSLTTMSALLVTATAVAVWLCMSIYNRKPWGIRYLIASLFGVLYLLIFFLLMRALLNDMKHGSNIFNRSRSTNWWYKWFG